MNQGEIVIYKASDSADFQIEVRVEDESVWLTQAHMAELFQTTRNNITLHIGNVFKERELDKASVCKESLLSAQDGKKYRTKSHDRFLIIDASTIYHIRASQKTWVKSL
jgi:hypothetical protein